MSGGDPIPRGLNLEQAQIIGLQRSQEQLQRSHEEMTQRLDRLTAAIDRLTVQNQNGDHESNGGNGGNTDAEEEERQPRQRRQQIDSTSNIKMRIPPFKGTSSPEEYLEWVQRVEKVFECHEYSEVRKCQLAALEFTDYANLWWENLKAQRRRDGEEEVRSWRLMKRLMQRRFVPDYYKQELYIKLQGLRQGGMCVEDYVKEFEMLKIRCELQEPEEQTIARFLGGLNREIADLVELQNFVFLEDVIKLAVKVERQRKRISTKQHVSRQVGNKIANSPTPSFNTSKWENKKLDKRRQ